MTINTENKKTIALLIDCDNISFKIIEFVLNELKDIGEIIIKRAYGNWSNDSMQNWANKLTNLSIKPIHQIDYTKGKNATDMAIVIDAMDLMHLKKAEAFAILSSDSDFTPLVMKLQEEGYKVYGFGYSTTPLSLKNACSIFTDVSAQLKELNNKEKEQNKNDKETLNFKVLDIFAKLSPNNKPITFESFNQKLKENKISYKEHGFVQLKLFLDSLNVFNLQVNEKNQGLISLKNTFEECNETLNVNQNQELMTQVLDCFNTLKDNNQVLLSSLFNLLGIKYNFHHKKYGYPNFKAFIKDLDNFSLVFENLQWYVKLN